MAAVAAMPAHPGDREYIDWTLAQLDLLKPDVRVVDWKRQRPQEPVAVFGHAGAEVHIRGAWCAVAEARMALPDGQAVVRRAFFYPPEPPATLALPAEAEGLI